MRKSTAKTYLVLKAAVLLLSAVYCLFMPAMTGSGLIYNAASYGRELTVTGVLFLVSAILMSAGTVLCGSRKKTRNMISVILSVSGAVLCLTMLHKLCLHADSSGWSDKFTMEQISHMYKRRLIPCVLPVLLSMVISAVRSKGTADTENYTSIV